MQRLRPGDRVRLSNYTVEVLRVTDCSATVRPTELVRQTFTDRLHGRTVTIEKRPPVFHIAAAIAPELIEARA